MNFKIYYNNCINNYIQFMEHNTIGDISVNSNYLLLSCENYDGYIFPVNSYTFVKDGRDEFQDYNELHEIDLYERIKEYIRYGFVGDKKNGNS